MANHSLQPICALGDTAPRIDRFDGATLSENPTLAMASVSARLGRDADCAARAKALFGFDLPGPGAMASAGDWSAFWSGPGQWMVTAPFASHEDIARLIKDGIGDAASVTEQTDGWVRFELSGPRTMDMFERLANVDIRRMQAGQAQRCQIEHLGTFVLCHEAGSSFSVITLRSAAGSMHHALETAAHSL